MGVKEIFNDNHGFTDSPARKDDFNIQRYISGLSNFIEKCNTPMTIAIQGDWGTGKTSIMSMVKDSLESDSDLHLVWFNTWQFSQFNMGDNLPLLMVNKLVNSIGDGNGEAKNTIKNLVSGLAGIAVGYVSGGAVDLKEMFSSDFMDQFEKLKQNFQDLVNAKAGENGRVVIFVDDLDRLQPGRAVELLEVLKLFLDCERCVFVLAIDYGVVSRGVKEKYGEDFSEEKGKSFFDKIIQVPFKMPIAEYDISNYVRTCFNEIGIEVGDDDSLSKYVRLINHSIGNNPRSMKRLFNSYLLLNNIATNQVLQSDENRQMLFAILCLQSRYEEIYNSIVSRRNILKIEELSNMAETEGDNPFIEDNNMSENQIKQFARFAEDFLAVIDKDNNDDISEEEFESFKNVLGFSTITSASNDDSVVDEEWKKYRHLHHKLCDIMIERLNKEFNKEFTEFKYKTKLKGNWWLFLPELNHVDPSLDKKIDFGFECLLEPDYKNKCSMLTLNIYNKNDAKTGNVTSMDDVKKVLGDNPLKNLNMEPIQSDSGIRYYNIMSFTEDTPVDELYNIVKTSFDGIKDYFIKSKL